MTPSFPLSFIRAWLCLSRRFRVVDGTTSREAGTFPQQLRHQDLVAAGCQGDAMRLLLPPLRPAIPGLWGGRRACSRGEETLWDSSSTTALQSPNVTLSYATRPNVLLGQRWGFSPKTQRPLGSVPSEYWTNYLLYLWISVFPLLTVLYLYRVFWSIQMKSAKSLGPGCDLFFTFISTMLLLDEGWRKLKWFQF